MDLCNPSFSLNLVQYDPILRQKFLIMLFFIPVALFAKQPVIELKESNLGNSFTNQATWIVDPERKLTIEQILSDTTLEFKQGTHNIENLNFTHSGFWFRFSVKNNLAKESVFLLETARPVTNKVLLYQVSGKNIVRHWSSGDNIPWKERAVPHRKCLFNLVLPDDNKRDFIIYMESDGEVITVPLVFRTPQMFMQTDYKQQLLFGLFYGVLFFVTIIYFFFFIALKEKSFLYYVLYVVSMAMLQLSLDGFAYQFFFYSWPYMADHFVMISACFGVFFVLLFGSSFLKLEKNAPGYYRIYSKLIPFIGVLCVMAFIPGPTYPIMYPLINIVSFISLLLTLVTIIHLKVKRFPVDWFFTIAFGLLIISIIIFILGNGNVIENPTLTEAALKVGTGMEVIFLSLSLAKKYRELQEAKEHAQKELLVQLEETNKLQANINVRLEEQVKERTKEISHQKMEIEEKNKEIVDSISYAKRIQMAILPPESIIKE
jgi:two-component system, sensor histidine kinase LadS